MAKLSGVSEEGGASRNFVEYQQRRAWGEDLCEVLVQVEACGVCHSDLHIVQNDLGNTRYPIVPGHEIAGVVAEVDRALADLGAAPDAREPLRAVLRRMRRFGDPESFLALLEQVHRSLAPVKCTQVTSRRATTAGRRFWPCAAGPG